MSKQWFGVAITGAFLLGMLGCTEGDQGHGDPKARLRDYISKSFAIKKVEERQELADYLKGEPKTRLSAWSDDQFRAAFIDNKREFVSFKVLDSKTINPNEVDITYELTFLDQGKGKDARVTNKKFAQMVQDSGKWYIASVRNIKELIEYKDELDLP